MPISIPVIEMIEIGAGGGSLAHVDGMRQIRVGPESAGSEPGPACYGRGGSRPAVTDADLVLGKIDPNDFAGGSLTLDGGASQASLAEHVGRPLAITAEDAAVGVAELVDENMANAARVHAVENGKELSQFTMIAFGGAAPLHAARLCEKLGITTLLVPPGAGVGSAIGFLRAPFGYEAIRGAYVRLSSFDPDWANEVIDGLEADARAVVREGHRDAELVVERKAFMRYAGQGWEIAVPLAEGRFGREGAEMLRTRFTAEYRRLFGRPLDGPDIEVMNWSVRVASPAAPVEVLQAQGTFCPVNAEATRRFFDAGSQTFTDGAALTRSDLLPGAFGTGPAVITERETTTVVPAGFTARMQSDGSLLLSREVRQ